MKAKPKNAPEPQRPPLTWTVYGSGKPLPGAIAVLARMAWDAAGRELKRKAKQKLAKSR